jgi:transcriptional regulator with XRE-family HTH domain
MTIASKTQSRKHSQIRLNKSAAAVEEALKVSGLSDEELARRLMLSVSTLRRIRKAYQPARRVTLEALQQIAAKHTSPVPVDLARTHGLTVFLHRNHDLFSQLKDFIEEQMAKQQPKDPRER